jgi:uncharacterized repeat protein (TIGR03803 family)
MNLARTFLLVLIFTTNEFIASAQVLQTLVSFNGTNGMYPNALTLGIDDNFYGTTELGGNINLDNGNGDGTVFQLTTNDTLTTLVSFDGSNGSTPYALTSGNDGNFYGMGGDMMFQVTTNGTLTPYQFSLECPPR